MAYSASVRCGDCKYWQRIDRVAATDLAAVPHMSGHCQRRAPTAFESLPYEDWRKRSDIPLEQKTGYFVAVFPMTPQDQWCGEFERNPYAAIKINLRDLGLHLESPRMADVLEMLELDGIKTVADWLSLGRYGALRIPNLGRKSFNAINVAIEQVLGIKVD